MRSGKLEGTEYAFGKVALPEHWAFPETRLTVQLVDPHAVFSERHLLHCIYSHLKALPLAKSKSMDLLLRIAGTAQIGEAMKLKPKRTGILVVAGKGSRKEYRKILSEIGARESGEIAKRKGDLDAMERTALLSL